MDFTKWIPDSFFSGILDPKNYNPCRTFWDTYIPDLTSTHYVILYLPTPSTMLPLGEKTLSFFFNNDMGAQGGLFQERLLRLDCRFWIPRARFWIPIPSIPDSKGKTFQISVLPYPASWANYEVVTQQLMSILYFLSLKPAVA